MLVMYVRLPDDYKCAASSPVQIEMTTNSNDSTTIDTLSSVGDIAAVTDTTVSDTASQSSAAPATRRRRRQTERCRQLHQYKRRKRRRIIRTTTAPNQVKSESLNGKSFQLSYLPLCCYGIDNIISCSVGIG